MMKLSTKGRYGTRLMVELAFNYGREPILLKEIAKRQEISVGYLDHLVPSLKAAGLIISARGSHGGYLLAKPPKDITVRNVVEALEGSISLVECVKGNFPCPRISACETRFLWDEASRNLLKTLDSFTLDDLVKKCRTKKDSPLMYNI